MVKQKLNNYTKNNKPLKVVLVAKPGGVNTGVGRYVAMLEQGLASEQCIIERIAPTVLPLPTFIYRLLRRMGLDLHTFLMNYPVWAIYPKADIYHFTSQNLASLLLFRSPKGKIIVTVHDIIPYMVRKNKTLSTYKTSFDRIFDFFAMTGLKKAQYIIADSEYTKQCLIKYLNIKEERIEVIYLGIDHSKFKPLPVSSTIYERYQLCEEKRYLIYVGSEDPRKNLSVLLHALAEVRKTEPNVELLKVGHAHFISERQKLKQLTQILNIQEAVHFLDDVTESDLPHLYNLAKICIMPSLYEGFGFPVLEAMACGTPVIYANTSSLIELGNQAGIGIDDINYSNLSVALLKLLNESEPYISLVIKGSLHVAGFSWSKAFSLLSDVYGRINEYRTIK